MGFRRRSSRGRAEQGSFRAAQLSPTVKAKNLPPIWAGGGSGGSVAAPVNLTPPSISGTAQVGQTLTRVPGTWSGTGNAYTFQWSANGVAITGATSPTYVLVTGDIGKTIRVITTATNAGGSASATSAPTSAVIAAAATASIVSAANRSRVPQVSAATLPIAAQVAGNGYSYQRYGERAPSRALTKLRPVFANLMVTSGSSTTLGGSLTTAINGGRQEQGVGVATQIRGSLVTGIADRALNQGAATTTPLTFNGAMTDASFSSGSTTYKHIYKLDNTQTPPVTVSRTYAQFQADGGVISASTVNGASLAASQATVPDGYTLIPDAGPSVASGAAYFAQLETRTPVVAVSSITADGAGNIVVALSAAGDIGLLRVGNFGTIASATGNTTVNGTWPISAIDTTANTITMSSATATNAAVTGTPTLRFGRPTGVINASVTANPLGDYQRSSATQQDYIGKGDWTGLGSNLTTDGGILCGYAMILAEDASGGPAAIIFGDSIAAEVRDGQTNSPTAILQGDADGNLTFANRIFGGAGLSWFRTAIPGMKASIAYQDGSDSFRRFMAGFADTAFTEMGTNDGSISGGYTATNGFKAVQQDHFTRVRAALRGSGKRLVATTFLPKTSQVGTDKWTTGRNSTYQTMSAGAFTFPTGFVYANYHPDLKNGVFTGVDAVFDLAYYAGNLDGSGVVDGYWAVDGVTNYKDTTDGTHLSKDGSAGIASQVLTVPANLTAFKTGLGPGF